MFRRGTILHQTGKPMSTATPLAVVRTRRARCRSGRRPPRCRRPRPQSLDIGIGLAADEILAPESFVFQELRSVAGFTEPVRHVSADLDARLRLVRRPLADLARHELHVLPEPPRQREEPRGIGRSRLPGLGQEHLPPLLRVHHKIDRPGRVHGEEHEEAGRDPELEELRSQALGRAASDSPSPPAVQPILDDRSEVDRSDRKSRSRSATA